MPATLDDIVSDPDFWKFPADQRTKVARQVDPTMGGIPDDKMDAALRAYQSSRPTSATKADSPPQQAVKRTFEPPVAVTYEMNTKTGEPKVRYGLTDTGRKNVATAVRIAGAASALIPGSAVVRGAVGSAAELGTETAELAAGERSALNPGAIGFAGLSAAVVPGVSGRPLYDTLKGGIYGLGSYTINNWLRGKPGIESPGWAAIATMVPAAMTGLQSRYYKGALNEILPRKEADIAADFLDGKVPPEVAKTWGKSKEAVKEIKGLKDGVAAARHESLPRTPFDYLKNMSKFEEPRDLPIQEASTPAAAETTATELAGRKKQLEAPPGTRAMWRIRRTKDVMADIEEETGVPTFSYYSNIREGLATATRYMSKAGEDLHSIFKGVSHQRRVSMQAVLEAAPKNRNKVATVLNVKPDDLNKISRLEDYMVGEFKNWGLDAKKFFREIMPKLRSAGSLEAAYPTGILPKEAEFFRHALESDAIGPEDRDSLALAIRLLRSGSTQEHVAPRVGIAEKNVLGRGDLADSIRKPFQRYIDTVKGVDENLSNSVADAMAKMASKIPGVEFSKRDARNMLDTITGLQYTSTMAFRTSTLVRNGFQGFQTAYPKMGKWYFVGVKQALTKEGKAIVEGANALAGDPQYLETLRSAENMTTHGVLQTTALGLRRLQAVGLRPYGKIDDFHIASVYLGMRARVLDAVKRGKNVNEIIDLADLDTFTRPETIKWKAMLEKGAFEEVADSAGKALAYDTQWSNMMPGDKPAILRGAGGRTLGGFTNWPLQYQDYLRRNALGPAPGIKKAQWAARWVLANGLLGWVAYEGASAIGYEHPFRSALSNTFINPGLPSGGPHFQMALSAVDAMQELSVGGGNVIPSLAGKVIGGDYEGEKLGPKTKKFMHEANAALIPLGQAVQKDLPDWISVLTGEDPAVLMRLIGFAPRTWGEVKR